MEQLFSEIYNRYFCITNRVLSKKGRIGRATITDIVRRYGFGESLIFLLPKLSNNEWELFEEDNSSYRSKLKGGIQTPLSRLQKRWLLTLLDDKRAGLFLEDEQISTIKEKLKDIKPLFEHNDFYCFDRFSDGDDYSDPQYKNCFRKILSAIKEAHTVQILYSGRDGRNRKMIVVPHRLEYSAKNDCFRLLCFAESKKGKRKYIMRLSRMLDVNVSENDPEISIAEEDSPKQRKVTLTIYDERNALERAMLQFADYRKNTVRLDDNSYRCDIFYNIDDETELLIELLSFGPMIKVEGNDHFSELIKKRLLMQKNMKEGIPS
jgi:hypothetical protein